MSFLPVETQHLPTFSLVLYSWRERFPAETLLPLYERYFERAGMEPHIASVEGDDPKEIKTYSIGTVRKRIEEGKIRNLRILNVLHLADKKNRQSDNFSIGYNVGHGDEDSYILTAIGGEEQRRTIALEFLRDMLSFISPSYGYSLELPLGNAPILFAHGMFARTEHADIETEAWQQAYSGIYGNKLHEHGKFRHVFAINVLSPPHLQNRIGGKLFQEWVKESNHGALEQWKDNVWVWFVPREDRIRVANILHFNGLMTAPDPFQNQLIG